MMGIDFGLAALAFTAGMASFFSPCAIALLPAYASLYIFKGSENMGMAKRALRGVLFGLSNTAAFVAIFVLVGTIVSILGSRIVSIVPYLSLALGGGLVAIGSLMFFGRDFVFPSLPVIHRLSISPSSELAAKDVVAYGAVFAMASLGCTLPIFVAMVTISLSSGGMANGILTFLFYALGMGLLMTVFSVLLGLSKDVMVENLNSWMPKMNKISSVVMVLAGLYIVNFYASALFLR